jgi:hypothetical protein
LRELSRDEKWILRMLANGPKQSVGGSDRGPDRAKQALRRSGLVVYTITEREGAPPIRMWALTESGRKMLNLIGRLG